MCYSNPNNYLPMDIREKHDNGASAEKELQQKIVKSANDFTDTVVALIIAKLQKKLRIDGKKGKPTNQIMSLDEMNRKPSHTIWLPPDYKN